MKANKGFTILEMVVVIGIILITLPLIFTLFFVNLQAQSKVFILQEVKRNGDSSLSIIQNLVRNRAYKIYSEPGAINEVCKTRTVSDVSPIYFRDFDKTPFYFDVVANQIASHAANLIPNPYILSGTNVVVSNFVISCNRTSTYSPAIVSISFKVDQPASVTRVEEKAGLIYQTKVKLRNY